MTDAEQQRAAIAGVFDRAAREYDRVGVDFFTPMGRHLVDRTAAVRPGEHVLDVGCGRGAVLLPAARAAGATGAVTGIDLAPAMVELTRAEAAAAGLDWVDVRVGDAEAPDLPDASYDVVLAGLVIFLLPDPVRALARYARLLRPGGRLAFSTFGAQDTRFRAAFKVLNDHRPAGAPPLGRGEADDPFRTAETIRELVTAAGFTDVTSEDVPFVSRFRDFAHWVEWTWSHGGRALLEQVPAADLPAALAEAEAALGDAVEPDGGLAITTEVRFTRALLPS